ncbi:MAG: AI-2E family transporter [Ilumatobacter fluminis]|jgi:predicted PurR-regulated permease PerM
MSDRAVETRPDRDAGPWAVPHVLERGAAWSWRIVVVAGALAVVAWSLARLSVVLIPVFVALVASALLSPVVERLATKLPRLLAVWSTLLTCAAAVAGLGYLLWGPLRSSFDDLSSQWDDAITDVEQWLIDGPFGLSAERVDRLSESARDAAERLGSGLLAEPASAARTLTEVVGGFFLAIVLTFFFLKDGPTMWRWLVDRVATSRRLLLDDAGCAAFSAMQGWIRGVAITGVADAILIGAALVILDVPAAIPLAVITFFAAFLPVVGATVAGGLATLIALVSDGPGTAIIVAIVVLAVQQIEGDILMPLVMQRQVSLHPVVVLVALAAGAAIAGIVGAIVAVPITAALSAAVSSIRSARTQHVLIDGPDTPVGADG